MSDSQAAILDAAAVEFADRGFDGVRMEHVARRAGYNKALVYRHFGDKQGLFDAMLRHVFGRREALLSRVPDSFAAMMVFWARAQRDDAHFLTLILREALQDDGSEPVEAEARRAYYGRQVAMIRHLQDAGAIAPGFDPETLFFALTGVTVTPVMLPQIGRLVTGERTDGDAFAARWEDTLSRLAEALAPRG